MIVMLVEVFVNVFFYVIFDLNKFNILSGRSVFLSRLLQRVPSI